MAKGPLREVPMNPFLWAESAALPSLADSLLCAVPFSVGRPLVDCSSLWATDHSSTVATGSGSDASTAPQLEDLLPGAGGPGRAASTRGLA